MEAKVDQTPAMNSNPLLSVNKNGCVFYSNEAGNTLLKEWDVRVGERLPSSVVDLVQKVIAENSPEKKEIKVGNVVYLVVFSPLPGYECVNISGFDISNQKEIEEALHESEERLRILGDNLPDSAVYQYAYEPDGTVHFLYISAGTEKLNDVKVSDVLNDANTLFRQIPPEYLKRLVEAEIRSSRDLSDFDMDVPMLLPDCQMRWFRLHSRPRRMPDGRTVWDGVQIDITERKRTEQALMESEERFRSAFDDSAVAMALVGPDARLMKVNHAFCQLLGFENSEMEGSSFLDFTYPDDIEPSIKIHKAVINREKPSFWLEKRYIRKDGRVIWCEVSSSPVLDSKGCPIYTVAHIQDITERKRAEEALKKTHDNLEEKVKERTEELQKAYDSLKKSENNLAEAQEMAHIGSWEQDTPNNECSWSDELYRIFGLKSQESMTYKKFLNYVHQDDRDYVYNSTNDAFNGNVCAINYRIVRPDGEERIIHSKKEVIFDEKNNPVRIKGTLQDITEHKKTEEKIKILANVVESTLDAIGTLSLEGIVTSWNKGAEQIYGYSSDEIIGKHISIPDPSQLKNETQEYIELIKQTGMSYRYITSRMRKDREIIDVSITLSPVIDSHGKLIAISFISRNITEQKRAEEIIRESEEKYRNIVETANEGIALLDREGIITYLNKKMADIIGYSSDEMIGRFAWDFVVSEDVTIAKSNIEKRHLHASGNYDIKLKRKDGSPIWVAINTKSLFDEGGKYIGSLSMHTDITKRKEDEETLKNIEIVRKQEIHHRIKNNLQVISSLLDLQVEKLKNRKCIKDCKIECIRNSEFIDAFKESQDRVISMALIHEELYKGGKIDTLNFSQYIKELTNNLLLTYRLGNEGISLYTDMKNDIFFVMDTAVPLGIIINELISNSLKHAFPDRDNGEIQIKLHQEENGECKSDYCNPAYVLTVSDNGIGISENLNIEDLDSLGLQLVTTLVDQLNGEFKLNRKNGTEFIIRFTVTEKKE